MKKRWKNSWVEALLSGHYEQTFTSTCYREEDRNGVMRYHPLGVLCDQAAFTWEGPEPYLLDEQFGRGYVRIASDVMQPEGVKLFGLSNREINTIYGLSHCRWRFPVIASFIEANF